MVSRPFTRSVAQQLAMSARSIRTPCILHHKCRNALYPNSQLARFFVPDEKVHWDIPFPEYTAPSYTSSHVAAQPVWADPDINSSNANKVNIKWNSIDKKVNRCSHMGKYEIHDNVPRNRMGRTGMTGRGNLGKWGPNHAADPIVTRWKRSDSNAIQTDAETGLPILQFVAIQRQDNGQWAIPGGMVEPGEKVSLALKREFSEEALSSLDVSPKERKALMKSIASFFSKGWEVYRGYVDDPRNTDNVWMETIAVNFHDDSGTTVGQLNLHAGSDAANVYWMDLSSSQQLYASHSHFLEAVAKHHKANW